MSTPLDELTRAQQAADQADALGREARTRLAEAERDTERERRARRADVWRRHLAEIEGTDHQGAVARARADLTASIRGEIDLPPVTALYRLQVAERLADQAEAERSSLQRSLGLPVTARPAYAAKTRDAMRVLADVLEAESKRTVQDVADRRRAEVEAAWFRADLPSVPHRLDPSRHRWFQDQVGRVESLVREAERAEAQAQPLVIDANDPHGRAVQERSREAARERLGDLRRALAQAQRDLADFESGRIT